MGRGVLLVFCYVASASVPLDAEYLDYFPEALLPPHLLTTYAYDLRLRYSAPSSIIHQQVTRSPHFLCTFHRDGFLDTYTTQPHEDRRQC